MTDTRHLPPLISAFSAIPDPRSAQGRRYALPILLVAAFVAMLCGARGAAGIAEWLAALGREDRRNLGFLLGRTPCAYTFWRLFSLIDTVELDAALARYFAPLLADETAIAVDGKTLRGSGHHEFAGVHLLSAFGHSTGCVFNQKWVSAKTNEITTIIPLLSEIHIDGKVITADALHTQREFCDWLIKHNAHYVLTVKGNQKLLQQDLADCFGLFPPADRVSP